MSKYAPEGPCTSLDVMGRSGGLVLFLCVAELLYRGRGLGLRV